MLDGKVQSALYDEFIYHESLVHPPALIAHGKPERVLIIGGGEGATAREALKHKSVREVIMVDLDEAVVNASKKYLPEMGGPTRSAIPGSSWWWGGWAQVRGGGVGGEFDAIIIDATDPMEGGARQPPLHGGVLQGRQERHEAGRSDGDAGRQYIGCARRHGINT